MTCAYMSPAFVNRFKNVPWEVVPYTLLGLAVVLLLFWAINKLLTPFFREEIEEDIREEKENG